MKMPIPENKRKALQNALQEAYEKEISKLLSKPEPEDDLASLDDELDFDCEHYNRIETYDD